MDIIAQGNHENPRPALAFYVLDGYHGYNFKILGQLLDGHNLKILGQLLDGWV